MLAVLPTTEAEIESQFSTLVVGTSSRNRTPMDIRIESLLAGAERAVGAVVIIDVFRAFTTAPSRSRKVQRRSLSSATSMRPLPCVLRVLGTFAWERWEGSAPEALTLVTPPSRHHRPISRGEPSFSAPAPALKASSPPSRLPAFMPDRWSPPQQPCAPFSDRHRPR